jgi:hypothetical protein
MIYTADAGWIDGQIIGGTDYYLEVRKPTLFNKGSVALYEYAHPDSMSQNHLIERGDYDDLSALEWMLNRLEDPIETVWGTF